MGLLGSKLLFLGLEQMAKILPLFLNFLSTSAYLFTNMIVWQGQVY